MRAIGQSGGVLAPPRPTPSWTIVTSGARPPGLVSTTNVTAPGRAIASACSKAICRRRVLAAPLAASAAANWARSLSSTAVNTRPGARGRDRPGSFRNSPNASRSASSAESSGQAEAPQGLDGVVDLPGSVVSREVEPAAKAVHAGLGHRPVGLTPGPRSHEKAKCGRHDSQPGRGEAPSERFCHGGFSLPILRLARH